MINSLSSSFDKPGITTIAYVSINPVTREHNNVEKNNDMFKISILLINVFPNHLQLCTLIESNQILVKNQCH